MTFKLLTCMVDTYFQKLNKVHAALKVTNQRFARAFRVLLKMEFKSVLRRWFFGLFRCHAA